VVPKLQIMSGEATNVICNVGTTSVENLPHAWCLHHKCGKTITHFSAT
jgi:hypothetical protein